MCVILLSTFSTAHGAGWVPKHAPELIKTAKLLGAPGMRYTSENIIDREVPIFNDFSMHLSSGSSIQKSLFVDFICDIAKQEQTLYIVSIFSVFDLLCFSTKKEKESWLPMNQRAQ